MPFDDASVFEPLEAAGCVAKGVTGALGELAGRGLHGRREVGAGVVRQEREGVQDRPRGREFTAPERSPSDPRQSRENRRERHARVEDAARPRRWHGRRLCGGILGTGAANRGASGGDKV